MGCMPTSSRGLRPFCAAVATAVLSVSFLTSTAPAAQAKPKPAIEAGPLAQAHAHNDYEHTRPLHDALDHSFTSVEADVWLVDGAARSTTTGTACFSC